MLLLLSWNQLGAVFAQLTATKIPFAWPTLPSPSLFLFRESGFITRAIASIINDQILNRSIGSQLQPVHLESRGMFQIPGFLSFCPFEFRISFDSRSIFKEFFLRYSSSRIFFNRSTSLSNIEQRTPVLKSNFYFL